VAHVLTERGHQVAFAGQPEMVPRVRTAGFRSIEITNAYAEVDRYPQGLPFTKPACYLTSPAVEQQIASIVANESPNLICIDAMFPAALAHVADYGCPTVVFSHSFVFRQLDMWHRISGMFIGMREQAGFGALPPLEEAWLATDRIIVTGLAAFDGPRPAGWDLVRHVGAVLEDEKFARPRALPWPEEDATPLVLISFSTMFEQRNADNVQKSLDALSGLDVHVVATTAGIVALSELTVPDNAVVLDYAAHDPILCRAALLVTHGGHGTAMRALKHGVPMVLIPGLAGDQPYVAAAVQEWGAGRALPQDAGVETIRTAAEEVLGATSFAAKARERATMFVGIDGAANAADEIEAVLALKQSRLPPHTGVLGQRANRATSSTCRV
jgi:UDP:flavonoid glycosyltransferase YjiC (YdhE family)